MKLKELKNKLPYTYKAIEKMFKIINISKNEYDNVIVDDNDNQWFMQYSWTEEQQNEYEDWLYRFLWNTKEARAEIMSMPIRKKIIIDKTVSWFILNYGLKISNK